MKPEAQSGISSAGVPFHRGQSCLSTLIQRPSGGLRSDSRCSLPAGLAEHAVQRSLSTRIAHPEPPRAAGELTRSETDKKIAGVAGGMAAYFGLDPTLVRVAWVIVGLMAWGILAYVIFWIVLPKGPGSTPAVRLAEERFARGEITAEDLQRIRSDLEGPP